MDLNQPIISPIQGSVVPELNKFKEKENYSNSLAGRLQLAFPRLPRFQVASKVVGKITGGIKNLFSGLGTMTTDYGGQTKYEKFHPAIDIANQEGTGIPAFVEGTVSEVVTGKKQGDKGYGNYVVITDAQGNKHKYSHLSQVYVKPGQRIAKGQLAGIMGNTGSTYSTHGGTGTHLDYRISNTYNRYVNPYTYLKKFYT